ncbi:MAG: RNA polymerase sigma factor [Leptospiraceae bacterium]|nr:RNA polymerase sigma factor [Leptospiraceae bacterium]MDW7975803.1 RNA polymerase sigma factor [Leptospiraceae bacterium]
MRELTLEQKIQKIKIYYEKYSQEIINFIYRSTQDYPLSCDILQDTFVNFLKVFSNKALIDEEKVRFYLFQTAKNLLINHYRKSKRIFFIDFQNKTLMKSEMEEKLSQEAFSNSELQENEKKVQKLLSFLSIEERILILLRYHSNLKLEEIAELEKTSISTISRRIEKIEKKLKEIAKKEKIL